jgi:hypothetical protein
MSFISHKHTLEYARNGTLKKKELAHPDILFTIMSEQRL